MRAILNWICLACFFVSILFAAAYFCVKSGLDLPSIQQHLAFIRIWGVAIQVAVVLFLGVFWRSLVQWARTRKLVQEHEYTQVLALRTKVMTFLIAYLLLIPIGMGTVVGWFVR